MLTVNMTLICDSTLLFSGSTATMKEAFIAKKMELFFYPGDRHYKIHQALYELSASLQAFGEIAMPLLTADQQVRLQQIVDRLAQLGETATTPTPVPRQHLPGFLETPIQFLTDRGAVKFISQGQAVYFREGHRSSLHHALWEQQLVVDDEVVFTKSIELGLHQFPTIEMATTFAQMATLQMEADQMCCPSLPDGQLPPEPVLSTERSVVPVMEGAASLEQSDQVLLTAAKLLCSMNCDRLTGSQLELRQTLHPQGQLIEVRSAGESVVLASGIVKHTRDASGVDTFFSSLEQEDVTRLWLLDQELQSEQSSLTSFPLTHDAEDLGYESGKGITSL